MIQFLVHEPKDSVGVATVDIKAGAVAKGVTLHSKEPMEVRVTQDIPLGHKIALVPLKTGDTVMKYGHDIGRMVAPAETGELVHVHNLKTKRW